MFSKKELFTPEVTRKLKFGGLEYDCIPGAVDITSGEFTEALCDQATGAARVWLADFETAPKRGDTVTFFDEECRVIGIHYDNFRETAKLLLGDLYHA